MGTYHDKLKILMDEGIYKITKNFPREEMFGVTSQIRRPSLSIILNYILRDTPEEKGIIAKPIKILWKFRMAP